MRCTIFLLLCLLSSDIPAQEKAIPYPHLSPLQKIEIQIGIIQFKLEYSKPSMRGRQIFGGLEPYGEVWRTGANKNTKLSFDESIIINGDTLNAGNYTLFTKPNKDQWTIYFYDYIDWYGVPKDIDSLNIITQLNVRSQLLKDPVETMDISFGNLRYGSGDIELRWEHTLISIPFTIPYPSIIENRLSNQINILARDYATTADIYLNKKKDSDTALKYLNLCTQTRENGQTFDEWLSNLKNKDLSLPWAHFRKSKIYADRKDYQMAIDQANYSIQIAQVVGSNYYKRENAINLKAWKDNK